MEHSLFFRVAGVALLWSLGEACTIIAVGKDASATGYPMVSHSDDSGPSTTDVRLVRVPRRKWPKGSKRKLYEWRIPYPRTDWMDCLIVYDCLAETSAWAGSCDSDPDPSIII